MPFSCSKPPNFIALMVTNACAHWKCNEGLTYDIIFIAYLVSHARQFNDRIFFFAVVSDSLWGSVRRQEDNAGSGCGWPAASATRYSNSSVTAGEGRIWNYPKLSYFSCFVLFQIRAASRWLSLCIRRPAIHQKIFLAQLIRLECFVCL